MDLIVVIGAKEDPWISSKDHLYRGYSAYNDEHSMLYGETYGAPVWNYYLLNRNGCNVFIK